MKRFKKPADLDWRKRKLEQLAAKIESQEQLQAALANIPGDQALAIIEGLRPYLRFEPVSM